MGNGRLNSTRSVLVLVLRWTGVAAFACSTAYCIYTFVSVWSRPARFTPGAIFWNVVLFALFSVHHSVFARESAKRFLTRLVPAVLIRSMYVWVASALLVMVCSAWRTIGGQLYQFTGLHGVALTCIQVGGVIVIAWGVHALGLRDLAGVDSTDARQALRVVGPYLWVRHPLYLGWILATFGAPNMTGDRFVFACISGIYILVAIPLEERSLGVTFGKDYSLYLRRVPWRLIPRLY